MSEKWDRRFIDLAKVVADWSKDPSTKVGAVIADGKRIVSIGYNGLPQEVDDSAERLENRDVKYQIVVHGEMNAILFAERSLKGCDLFTWPFMPCSRCAAMIIQTGIKRCVAPEMSESLKVRWQESCGLATQMFKEAGVELVLLK